MDESSDGADGCVRRRIVESAWKLGCAEGQVSLTMRRIAHEADVATTAIYAHFADKASLLRELAGLADARLDAELARPIERAAIDDALGVLCQRYVVFVRDHAWFFRVVPRFSGDGPPLTAPNVFVQRARGLLRAHEWRDEDERLVRAAHLYVAIEGIAFAWSQAISSAGGTAAAEWAAFAESYIRVLVRALC